MGHLNITGVVLGSNVNKINKTGNSLASWSLQPGKRGQPYKQIILAKSYRCNPEKYAQERRESVKERRFSSTQARLGKSSRKRGC